MWPIVIARCPDHKQKIATVPANTLKTPFAIAKARILPREQLPIEEMVKAAYVDAMLHKIEQALGFAEGNQIVDAIWLKSRRGFRRMPMHLSLSEQ
jgi:hypothetical protein